MASTAQLWLTSVLTDEEVPNALVLGFSLKEAMTSRKVGVIASSKISGELKAALAQCFDFFFPLEESWNKAGLKSEDFVKVSALTIRSFKKIVFLEPYMLALKNCDEIFDQYNNFRTFILPAEGKASVFVVQPSFQAFNGILAALACSTNGKNLESFLRTWIKNQNVEYPFLHEKYNQIFDMESGMLLGNEDEICIVNMINNKELKGKTGQRGLIAKQILDKWEKIYQGYVQPLLSSNNQSNIFSLDSPLPLTYSKEPIAIVGMSCRYPGANSLEEFWNLLVEGQDATGNPPEFRWLREECSRSMKPEFRKTNAGFLKCPVDEFDSKFFGISPKEMVNLDPQHRLLHELVWEGLEDAAVNPKGLRGTNGAVFIGSWTNDYRDILEHGGNNEFYRAYMGNSIGAAAARLSFLLGMTGPSIATESGCSSAMVAVHLACKSLQNGETNFALACGVNLLLHPFDKDEMPMVISSDGHCKTFDAKADGFARGEGCGVLVLKRLSDAVRYRDNIWGLIRGSGMTQEGVSKSMGTPTVHCESLAMEQALADAEVEPEDVSYVEAHGTGTPVGDPMEVAAIAKAYHSSNREEPLLIGSVKTYVGHTESCSGITGIMKVILAMQHEMIPPHRNFETLNPSINLDAVPAVIPLTPVDWPKVDNKPRLARVSSFGITGTDAHAIIEEPPALPPNSQTRALNYLGTS